MADATPPANRLLSALPADSTELLRPHVETVPLAMGEVLYDPHQALAQVWFPLRGAVALVTPMPGNPPVEAVEVGPEGMVGLALALGAEAMAGGAVVRVPGEAARVAAGPFRRALDRDPALRRLLARYALALVEHMARHTACAQLHGVEKRLASRLLLIQDAVHGAASFPLTHETAAEMLGVHRPTVSAAAVKLQRAGLIAYTRGNVAVLDKQGLEAVSCGCHRAGKAAFDRLAGGRD